MVEIVDGVGALERTHGLTFHPGHAVNFGTEDVDHCLFNWKKDGDFLDGGRHGVVINDRCEGGVRGTPSKAPRCSLWGFLGYFELIFIAKDDCDDEGNDECSTYRHIRKDPMRSMYRKTN